MQQNTDWKGENIVYCLRRCELPKHWVEKLILNKRLNSAACEVEVAQNVHYRGLLW